MKITLGEIFGNHALLCQKIQEHLLKTHPNIKKKKPKP